MHFPNLIPFKFFIGGFFLIAVVAATGSPWQPGSNYEQILLWPNGAPDNSDFKDLVETAEVGEGLIAGKPVTSVKNVSKPTITVYPAKGSPTGTPIVVFPGGGYRGLAIDFEGSEVCDWLTPKGVTCIVLKYRVPYSGPSWHPECNCAVVPKVFTALQDAQRAIGLVRFNAEKWKIDKKKIGVIGFSAGGHLVAATSTNFKKRIYSPIDAADGESCRPDFGIDLYGGHMSKDPGGEDLSEINPGIKVTSETPPTFIVHAVDDSVDPVEYSTLYFAALKKAKVPVEMHLFPQGGHAFGLRRTDQPITHWTDLAEEWLSSIKMTPKH